MTAVNFRSKNDQINFMSLYSATCIVWFHHNQLTTEIHCKVSLCTLIFQMKLSYQTSFLEINQLFLWGSMVYGYNKYQRETQMWFSFLQGLYYSFFWNPRFLSHVWLSHQPTSIRSSPASNTLHSNITKVSYEIDWAL